MALDLANYETCVREAVIGFWMERDKALTKKKARPRKGAKGAAKRAAKKDVGNRGAVTGGAHLKGFEELIRALTRANGLPRAEILVGAQLVTLPGFFRPTKRWDVLVMNGGRLVAAFEFKSQVGSVGKNFNNRTEEAIGSARCLLTACEKGALGEELSPPFLGWLMVAEESPESTRIREIAPSRFRTFPEFDETSYLDRYDILCRKLMAENLYHVAAVISTPKAGGATDGRFKDVARERDPENGLGLLNFAAAFAGRVAAEAELHPEVELPAPPGLA